MFDWKNSSVDDLARKIATIPSSHVQSQLAFYERKRDTTTIERILLARKLSAVYRLRLRADLMLEKLNKELGEDIANSNPKENVGVD